MSFTLRELTEDQNAILAQVESGEFSLDDVSDHLDMLETDRKAKIESYLHVINRLQTDVVAVTAELDRLHDIEKSKSKALARMKDWLLMSMVDGEKHEFDLFKVSRVKGRQSVVVVNQGLIPAKFLTTKEVVSIDKKSIANELKLNPVDGAELVTGKSSLRIK